MRRKHPPVLNPGPLPIAPGAAVPWDSRRSAHGPIQTTESRAGKGRPSPQGPAGNHPGPQPPALEEGQRLLLGLLVGEDLCPVGLGEIIGLPDFLLGGGLDSAGLESREETAGTARAWPPVEQVTAVLKDRRVVGPSLEAIPLVPGIEGS